VDRVDVTVLVDNSTDMLLPDVPPDAGPVTGGSTTRAALPAACLPSSVGTRFELPATS
jgi:hypothetical protein